MKAGQLKHRIVIEQQAQTKNAIDEIILTWSTFCTVWAAIEPATGQTYYAANQLESKVDGRVRIRYRDDIEPTMRIKFGDRILNIISIVHPQQNRRELHLMYSEGLD